MHQYEFNQDKTGLLLHFLADFKSNNLQHIFSLFNKGNAKKKEKKKLQTADLKENQKSVLASKSLIGASVVNKVKQVS